jgi:hypothetical protein
MHYDFSVETSPATRKTQSFLDFDENCYFVLDWDISLFWCTFYSILHAKSSPGWIHHRNKPCDSQNSIFPRFRRKLCYFVTDWDISAFKLSFHSILCFERSACRFLRGNKPSISQNTIFLPYRRKRLFRTWLRYFGVYTFVPLHSMRRTQCMPISGSKQAQQLAKHNLSSLSTKTVISLLIEIFRRLNALSTPFYAANAVHADFSVETSPASRKTQSFFPFDENCHFALVWDISVFRRSFHSIPRGERNARRFQRRNKHSNSQNSIFPRFGRKFVISFLIEIFRRLNALSTPFYAAIAVHNDFSVETSPATRKT